MLFTQHRKQAWVKPGALSAEALDTWFCSSKNGINILGIVWKIREVMITAGYLVKIYSFA